MSKKKIELLPIRAKEWAEITGKSLEDCVISGVNLSNTIHDYCDFRREPQPDPVGYIDYGYVSSKETVERIIQNTLPEGTEVVVNFRLEIKEENRNAFDHGYELPMHYHYDIIYRASGVAIIPKRNAEAIRADAERDGQRAVR